MTFEMHASAAVLARLFPDEATIERPTDSQDDEGGITQSWSTVYADIPAQFAPLGGSLTVQDSERRVAAGEFVQGRWQAILQGDYAVTERDRCLIRGKRYGITGSLRDSYAIATVLHLEDLDPDSTGEESS